MLRIRLGDHISCLDIWSYGLVGTMRKKLCGLLAVTIKGLVTPLKGVHGPLRSSVICRVIPGGHVSQMVPLGACVATKPTGLLPIELPVPPLPPVLTGPLPGAG